MTIDRSRDGKARGPAGERIAYAVPGDAADVLLSLPLIAENCRGPVDLWISKRASPLRRFLERQPSIRRVWWSSAEVTIPGEFDRRPPLTVYGRYDDVISLDPLVEPSGYWGDWLAALHGLEPPSPEFRFETGKPRSRGNRLVVLANRDRSSNLVWKLQLSRRLVSNRWSVVEFLAGGRGVANFEERAAVVANASWFVGCDSPLACVALLNHVPAVLIGPSRERRRLATRIPPTHRNVWFAEAMESQASVDALCDGVLNRVDRQARE